MKIKQFYFSVIIACLLKSPIFGQQFSPLSAAESHLLKSSFNQQNYFIQVSLPKNYQKSDSTKYPVLYVLDGNASFAIFHSARAMMDMGKEIQNIIIVGIDTDCKTDSDWLINRHADYTPSHNGETDKMFAKFLNIKEGALNSGSAAAFLNTLELEIIPFIEKNYQANSLRGLTGHSLGGLFTAYCLFTKPQLFVKYGINSPSLWWNNNEIINTENEFSMRKLPLKADVFLSMGELEGDIMVQPYNKFTENLKSRNYESLKMETQFFEKETHLSVSMASISRTLKVLYKPVPKYN